VTRKELESKVQITWEPGENVNGQQVPFDRCCGYVELRSSGYFSKHLVGRGQLDEMERAVRESIVNYLIGDLEAENQRLLAALRFWGRQCLAAEELLGVLDDKVITILQEKLLEDLK